MYSYRNGEVWICNQPRAPLRTAKYSAYRDDTDHRAQVFQPARKRAQVFIWLLWNEFPDSCAVWGLAQSSDSWIELCNLFLSTPSSATSVLHHFLRGEWKGFWKAFWDAFSVSCLIPLLNSFCEWKKRLHGSLLNKFWGCVHPAKFWKCLSEPWTQTAVITNS